MCCRVIVVKLCTLRLGSLGRRASVSEWGFGVSRCCTVSVVVDLVDVVSVDVVGQFCSKVFESVAGKVVWWDRAVVFSAFSSFFSCVVSRQA